MNIVILDLEWNGSYSHRKKKYVNEIIEFGAVKCDEKLRILDTFSIFVKPQISKKISTVITDLTTITDDNLTDGVMFMRAVSLFKKWSEGCVVMTWGTSDILALIENCRYFGNSQNVPFLEYYCDIQAYADAVIGNSSGVQLGLAKAAEILGIDISSETTHRADGDSIVTHRVLKKIYDSEGIKKFIARCDKEFYDKITFKTSYISDLHDPKIRRSHLRFLCPKCSSACDIKKPWQAKNKGFRAEFRCKNCGYVFAGRVTLKEKYEGVVVSKKTMPIACIEEPEEASAGKVGNMELGIAENEVGILTFPDFSGYKELVHGFSTRIGGISQNEFAAMNLGFNRGDLQENVEENYRLFAQALEIDENSMVAGDQDHHINIRAVGKKQHGVGIWKKKDLKSVDGLCTNEKGTALIIYCADCVPLYFYDKNNSAIGLAHAGWKGTAAGMAKEMVERMWAEYGTKPEEVLAAIGPSISKKAFEVDAPVAKVFMALKDSSKFVEDSHDGKFHVDLWECNRQYLLQAGVKPENIFTGGVCTMGNSRLVFSHRKTRGRRGSNAAVMALR